MKPTELEKALLAAFFTDNQIAPKEFVRARNAIEVADRTVCRGGYMVTFKPHQCLKVGPSNQDYHYVGITGLLNREKINVGFLFYIEKGYITTIEGFGFGEAWPRKIASYELMYGGGNKGPAFGLKI